MTNQDLPSSYIFAIIDRFDPQNLFFFGGEEEEEEKEEERKGKTNFVRLKE
jgi:hypothetical protein